MSRLFMGAEAALGRYMPLALMAMRLRLAHR